MNEVERNKLLFLLLDKLIVEKDYEAINLIQTLIVNDTDAMKKTFQIMTNDLKMLLSFNGRTGRYERPNVGSNPTKGTNNV